MDFDERMEMRVNKYLCTSQQQQEEDMTMRSCGDTFAQRAEWYSQRLPQLLSLLQDLYRAYTNLLHCCNRLQPPPNNHYSSPPPPTTFPLPAIDNWDGATSTLSQPLFFDKDMLVAEMVIIKVENDILQRQLGEAEVEEKLRYEESSRKIDLLKKLLEVLESERVVVLNENMRLGFKVQAFREENKGLLSEAMFLKRKAVELARCVLKMREDHRVCMPSKDLQGQSCGLEKRNKEYHYHYHQQRVFLEEEKEEYCRFRSRSRSKEKNQSCRQRVPNLFASCFQLDKITKLKKKKKKKKKKNECVSNGKSIIGAKRMRMWWKMAKNMDLGIACGLH